MLNVFECVTDQHDIRLVLLAALVCALGSLANFILLRRAFDSVERRRKQWTAVAAVAAGICVWSTHFIAMLAYRGPMPFYFDAVQTVASAALAIGFFWIAFNLLDRGGSYARSIIAGNVAGAGVSAMHFMGMAAIVAPADIHYAPGPIAAFFTLSSIAFAGGFALFFGCRGWKQLVLPSLAMIAGIVLLHFSAMTYTTLIPDPNAAAAVAQGSRHWIVTAVVGATMGLLIMVLASATVDRLLTDLQGLAEATLEGLMIVNGDEILEANGRACAMIGVRVGAVIGSSPDDWFESFDGLPVAKQRGAPGEARVRDGAVADQIVEIASHTIEYRGRPCQVLALRDLTERKRAQRAVEHLASHDPLTDLANRAAFDRALAVAFASRAETRGKFALIAIDLDRFKAVNDVFGHAAGDDILRRVAGILKDAAGAADIVARIGGDEFMILQNDVAEVEDTRRLTALILERFALAMDPALDPKAVGVSLGVAIFPEDGREIDVLRHNADVALYRAKQQGRGIACFFDEQMDRAARDRRQLEHDLRHAITRHQLGIEFQPLVATDGGTPIGYEALLRWRHPERGEIAPDQFVSIAEDIGAIIPIGEWVLREACRQAAGWPDHLTVAVNVSAVQFRVPNLPAAVRSALADSGLEPYRLELEITESVLLGDRDATLATLHEIKAMGVQIVMDDFGTGYSSLSNLQSFPFDKLKIDRSFIAAMTDDHAARPIIRAIVALGRSLDLPIVAEGVETEAECLMVLEEGCPQAQGYLFGRPARCLDLAGLWGQAVRRAG